MNNHSIPSRGRLPRLLLASLLLSLALGGCDEFGSVLGGDDTASVQGTWVHTDGSQVEYLEITSNTFTVYASTQTGCFVVTRYSITVQSGDTYTLENQDSGVVSSVVLRVEDGQLNVREAGEDVGTGVLYDPSTEDVTTLDECTNATGGDDPSVDCSSLPAIHVGETLNGELTTSDSFDGSFYFDLYGLTLASERQVTIGMSSTEFDTYIYLYEADGTYIDEDDDDGGGNDSSLAATLPAGCYRIEASSWDYEATGAYTLTVD